MFAEVKKLNKKIATRLAIVSGIAIGVVVAVLFGTVTRPKHTQFCAKCHNNISFNNACKKSSPGDVACIECHTHENKGTAVMAVEIRNEHCTAELCHSLSKLSEKAVSYKKIKPFQHKTHTDKFNENLKLRCTSCHASLGGDKHFELDVKTCNICHFIAQHSLSKSLSSSQEEDIESKIILSIFPLLQEGDDVGLKNLAEKKKLLECNTIHTLKSFYTKDNKSISDCTLCHDHIEKTKEIYGKTFKHDVYEENEKVNCSDCHFETIQGDGRVDKNSCYRCHSDIADNFKNTSDMHNNHIDKHKIACTSCHGSITHGWIKPGNEVYRDDYNLQSGTVDYKVQELIMLGMGGVGIEGEPDPMYLATLNCSACHKDKQRYANMKPDVCNNCHEKGFDKILAEQMRFVTIQMRLLKGLLIKAKRRHNIDSNQVIYEAEVNYNLIKEDGSLGAHNIKYVKYLLDYNITNLKQVVKEVL